MKRFPSRRLAYFPQFERDEVHEVLPIDFQMFQIISRYPRLSIYSPATVMILAEEGLVPGKWITGHEESGEFSQLDFGGEEVLIERNLVGDEFESFRWEKWHRQYVSNKAFLLLELQQNGQLGVGEQEIAPAIDFFAIVKDNAELDSTI